MPAPANPLRLQVIDRIVAVLKAIVAGDSYFYTPYEVNKKFTDPYTAAGFPCYSVFTDSGGAIEVSGAGNPAEYDENFYITIKGIVAHATDTVTVLEKCLRDVRKAINVDSLSGAAGSLGVLAIETRIEEGAETDNGALSFDGLGYFDQRVRCRISGDYGEL